MTENSSCISPADMNESLPVGTPQISPSTNQPRLPWITNSGIQLVYHSNARSKSDVRDNIDIRLLVGQMMFSYGDHAIPYPECKDLVTRTVTVQLQHLLVACTGQKTNISKITYKDVILYLLNKCPLRLRRLVQYLMYVHRKMADVDKTVPTGMREQGNSLFNDINDSAPSSVIAFKRSCPLIYSIMRQRMTDAEMEHFTANVDNQGDAKHYRMKDAVNRRRHVLSDREWQLYKAAKRVSFCSSTGRRSAFRAEKFHELLMFPPLQTDLIFIIDFLGKEIVRELVFYASEVREVEWNTKCALRPMEDFPTMGTVRQVMARRKDTKINLERQPINEPLTPIHYRQGMQVMMDTEKSRLILNGQSYRILPSLKHSLDPVKVESDLDYILRTQKEKNDFYRFYSYLDGASRDRRDKKLRFPANSRTVNTETALCPISRMLNGTRHPLPADLHNIDREVKRMRLEQPLAKGNMGSSAG